MAGLLQSMVDAVSGRSRWRTRTAQLELLLAEQFHRLEHHSRRLESLWKLASQPQLRDEAFLRALLAESSAAIHPGPLFSGAISHREGAEIVVDVGERVDAVNALADGARLPVAQSLLSELLRTGKTCSWSDVRSDERIAAFARVPATPCRAFIGTPFRVGASVYFLNFTSDCALVEPFAEDDHTYVEIVASFCASRLHQRDQFERLCYESTHDALTGLSNRAAFRVAGTQAVAAGKNVALALVDIDGFRSINEAFGHQTADAVLVEVAAALRSGLDDGDVVARIGGDTFAVLFGGAACRADVERRVERIRAVFGTPFGTGDRDGKQRVAATASLGVAVAPRDGTSFEQLLSRADAAVREAKEELLRCVAC
jgi:diguanylate cyclase (GGDEF)-like protein